MGALAGLVAVSAIVPVAACNGVLGIGEAMVDPTLDGGPDGAGADGGAGNPCSRYCTTVATNCKDINAEYISLDVCEEMCATFDPGQPGDMTNDSLACRLAHAELAATDPVTHCQQAGPLAAGSCTSACSAFCLLAFNRCNPGGLFPFDGGTKDCKAECEEFPYLVSADAGALGAVGDIVFLSGNTLNCRLYHLESAYTPGDSNAVKQHCPHTAADSATCN
jgi:hypothetical protein